MKLLPQREMHRGSRIWITGGLGKHVTFVCLRPLVLFPMIVILTCSSYSGLVLLKSWILFRGYQNPARNIHNTSSFYKFFSLFKSVYSGRLWEFLSEYTNACFCRNKLLSNDFIIQTATPKWVVTCILNSDRFLYIEHLFMSEMHLNINCST